MNKSDEVIKAFYTTDNTTKDIMEKTGLPKHKVYKILNAHISDVQKRINEK